MTDGQEVLLVNGHFSDEVWIVDQGELVSVIDLPQNIRASDGTARRFIEGEADKCGFVAKPQEGGYVVPYHFGCFLGSFFFCKFVTFSIISS